MKERALHNIERNRAIARVRAINYHINTNHQHMRQPELEKLLAEKDELEKRLKAIK